MADSELGILSSNIRQFGATEWRLYQGTVVGIDIAGAGFKTRCDSVCAGQIRGKHTSCQTEPGLLARSITSSSIYSTAVRASRSVSSASPRPDVPCPTRRRPWLRKSYSQSRSMQRHIRTSVRACVSTRIPDLLWLRRHNPKRNVSSPCSRLYTQPFLATRSCAGLVGAPPFRADTQGSTGVLGAALDRRR